MVIGESAALRESVVFVGTVVGTVVGTIVGTVVADANKVCVWPFVTSELGTEMAFADEKKNV